MKREIIVTFLVGIGALAAFWLLLQTPGSLTDALAHPFTAIAGTSEQINTSLLDFSQDPDPIRAAGQRLLQPFGIVRLVRVYRSPETDHEQKR